jgi:hypothetical protein
MKTLVGSIEACAGEKPSSGGGFGRFQYIVRKLPDPVPFEPRVSTFHQIRMVSIRMAEPNEWRKP